MDISDYIKLSAAGFFIYLGFMAILGTIWIGLSGDLSGERALTKNEKIGLLLWPVTFPVFICFLMAMSVISPILWVVDKFSITKGE